MNFTTYGYFLLLFSTLLFYHILPPKFTRFVITVSGIVFFSFAVLWSLIALAIAFISSYFSALYLSEQKKFDKASTAWAERELKLDEIMEEWLLLEDKKG